MVRTKAGSVSTKAVGGKAPQKVAITAQLSGHGPRSRNTGGNSYYPRETPTWQKPITCFMKSGGERSEDDCKENHSIENKSEEPHSSGLPGVRGEFSASESGSSSNNKKTKRVAKRKSNSSEDKNDKADGEKKDKKMKLQNSNAELSAEDKSANDKEEHNNKNDKNDEVELTVKKELSNETDYVLLSDEDESANSEDEDNNPEDMEI